MGHLVPPEWDVSKHGEWVGVCAVCALYEAGELQ